MGDLTSKVALGSGDKNFLNVQILTYPPPLPVFIVVGQNIDMRIIGIDRQHDRPSLLVSRHLVEQKLMRAGGDY